MDRLRQIHTYIHRWIDRELRLRERQTDRQIINLYIWRQRLRETEIERERERQ